MLEQTSSAASPAPVAGGVDARLVATTLRRATAPIALAATHTSK